MGVSGAKGDPAVSEQDIATLQAQPAGTIGHAAALEIARLREELGYPPDERTELHWDRGYRAALTGVLAKVCSDLGYDPDKLEARRASWIIEREGAIRALRDACRDLGDNDWPADLSLDDVIDKHLHRHFDAGRIVGTIQRLLKALPSDELRMEAFFPCCAYCGSLDPCDCCDEDEKP